MQATPARAIVTALMRDSLVQLYLAVLAIEAMIYTAPLLDPPELAAFGASSFQIPFIAIVVAASLQGRHRIRDAEERLYWTHLAAAVFFWLATLAWIALVPRGNWTMTYDVWTDASYLLFYSPILLAVECRPHLPRVSGAHATERQLRWAGVAMLVFGCFMYFVVAPVVLEPDLLRSELSSSLLFVTIDLVIVSRYAWRAWSCGSVRWRVLYGAIALAGSAVGTVDMLDVLGAVGAVNLPDGAITDLIWTIPPFFFLAAFRLRDVDLPRSLESDQARRVSDRSLDPVRVGAFLVGSALVFPMLHFVVHTAFTLSPALLQAQRVMVVVEMALLGALASAAYRILARERLLEEQAREAFEERLRQAHKLEAVSRLAGVVAREMTGPLQVMGSALERAMDTLTIGDPLRELAQRGFDQVKRLELLARHLTAVSRERRGQPERVDLADAISDAMPALRATLGPAIRVEAAPVRGCITLIDPAHLRALMLDLAANARDAMPDGGRFEMEVGRLALTGDAAVPMAVRPGSYVRLVVRDSGRGIPSDVLPHLFEPFFSTKADDSTDTAPGLGLASLYAIVTQHGGCVTVESEPGQGAAFEILLPAAV
jgi:signal transduction histidine kinase